MSKADKKLSLLEHIEELRLTIIKSVLFLIIVVCFSYTFVDTILCALIKPVGKLVFIAPQEAFVAKITIAFFTGLIFSSPFIIYQVWHFISSGLKDNEGRFVLIFGPLSLLFFLGGASFGYFVIVPIGMRFLLSFSTYFLTPMISISRYISFVGTLTIAFGVIFELPLAILFLTKIGVVTPEFLSYKRRYAIVLIFIAAAILTPPDIITQCLLAVPLLLLYEVAIIFSRFAKGRKFS